MDVSCWDKFLPVPVIDDARERAESLYCLEVQACISYQSENFKRKGRSIENRFSVWCV